MTFFFSLFFCLLPFCSLYSHPYSDLTHLRAPKVSKDVCEYKYKLLSSKHFFRTVDTRQVITIIWLFLMHHILFMFIVGFVCKIKVMSNSMCICNRVKCTIFPLTEPQNALGVSMVRAPDEQVGACT